MVVPMEGTVPALPPAVFFSGVLVAGVVSFGGGVSGGDVGQGARQRTVDGDWKIKQIERQGRAVGIQFHGVVHAAVQDALQHEIHGVYGFDYVASYALGFAKCKPFFSASSVSCSFSMGKSSGFQAITLILEMSPLSPVRLC